MIKDTSAQDKQLVRKHSFKKPLLLLAVIVITATGVGTAWPSIDRILSAEQAVSRSQLRTATVVKGDISEDIRVEGRTLAANNPDLYAIAAGTVTLQVQPGDEIQAGQPLLTIDSPELTNQLLQEQATFERLQTEVERQRIAIKQQLLDTKQRMEMAKVELEAAQREMARAKESISKQIISKLELEQSMVYLKRAELKERHAIESLKLEQERLSFELKSSELSLARQQHILQEVQRQVDALTITSPLSGIVGTVHVQQKQFVQRDAALLSLVDLSELEVEAQIPELYAESLAVGMAAEVFINQYQYPAQLVAISPEVEDGRVSARVRFTDQPKGLRQNQKVSTRIVLSHKAAVLKVRRGAFVETGAGRYTYTITGDQAKQIDIKLGVKSISEVEVLSGLQAGQEIVISSLAPFNSKSTVLLSK
ncbi:efflux RND transporter periplasmic adaptor subunit [Pseudoalteromonas 'SMAR']|uniref:efflux RND transporter periplasmic adaptor subunit n=1 Tax=Pseudoalteromonas 'SMAR' TaxID=3416908 RepID=UPI003AF27DC7